MDKRETSFSHPPVYLFKKLGRYLAVSTATGDFYDLSPSAYFAVENWNKAVIVSKDGHSSRYGIPARVTKMFPLMPPPADGDEENGGSCLSDITLNLTSRCNLRCNYCWNDYGAYSNRRFRKDNRSTFCGPVKNSDMTPGTARAAVDLLVDSHGEDKNLVVDFYGGEPLLNLKTLLSTVDYCGKNRKKWGVNFSFLLATNGTLLTPAVAADLFSRGVQVAVSIDGRKEVHDRNRPFADGKGSFSAITRNLSGMPSRVVKRLVGRATVTPFNSDMVALYADLRSLGFERIELFESEDACHRITPNRERFFFRSDKDFSLLCRQYERLARYYIKETTGGFLDYRKTFFNRFFKLMQRLYYHHELAGGCPAAAGQLAVDADGGIYPCTSFVGVEEFRLGNVRKGLDRTRTDAFMRTVKRRFEYCRECPIFSLCRTTGSCLNVNYYFNHDPAVPYRQSCLLFREKVELAIATLSILSEKIPRRLEKLFGFDPVGRRGNELY